MRTRGPAVRPLTPDDGAAVDAVFAGLSARSRYLRFHTPVARLTGGMRAALLRIAGCTGPVPPRRSWHRPTTT